MLKSTMMRVLIGTSGLVIALAAASSDALAGVRGVWYTDGTLVSTLKVKGYKPERQGASVYDYYSFYGDGVFQTLDFQGTWVQERTSFTATLDPERLANDFEQIYRLQGLTVDATVRSAAVRGRENLRWASIRGKLLYVIDLYFVDFGVSGLLKIRYTFNGRRAGDLPGGAEETGSMGGTLRQGGPMPGTAPEPRFPERP